ncbi:GDP-mannose mannosyl hydrolase [Vibrio ostreicida]|uniref:GDP-mannose mannosyl hydrolase n=1 Tax=Vibrio ostreicida TaxID=526588 RepID=A0ABT8BP18_9VIBR|nr:GDP-mannose mannosyl hydrolase [Vibrio ostreicida]MDN3608473.1 GDP-mannose mannosyl hydrolase [Vibrio ostreicida]NPD10295.1 GDP-mannose mannosyl hydrolase [Vibrio ostreicida]
MYLDKSTFSSVIEHTPLVSIDLIVENEQGLILLGKRLLKPAQGFWFVPGGRIQKNETLDEAFGRLTHSELGTSYCRQQANFKGVYTHHYDDSVFDEDFGTHYVVIAYHLLVTHTDLSLPVGDQHGNYHWYDQALAIESSDVHSYTKWYFQPH